MAPLLSTETQVELYEIRDGKQHLSAKGPLEVSPVAAAPRGFFHPPPPGASNNNTNVAAAAILTVGATHPAPPLELRPTTHAMRSLTDAGEDSFVLGQVVSGEKEPHFWAVVFPRGGSAPRAEAEALSHLLERLTSFSLSARAEKAAARAASAPPLPNPLKALDPAKLPQLDVKALNEVLRKGAEDTRMLLGAAGGLVAGGFAAAAEMHKKYAPAPSAQPAKVPEALASNLAHAKQAASAGSALARGASSGMQAATAELGGAVASAAAAATGGGGGGKGGKGDDAAGGNAGVARDVGSVGVEVLRDAAAVRDALLAAVGQAFGGARDAVVGVVGYQYGADAQRAAADAFDAAGGAGQMAVAGAMMSPAQVALSAAQRTADQQEQRRALEQVRAGQQQGVLGAGGLSSAAGARQQQQQDLARARAELEQERAALAAERARLDRQQQAQAQQAAAAAGQQQHKGGGGGPLGFLFGGGAA